MLAKNAGNLMSAISDSLGLCESAFVKVCATLQFQQLKYNFFPCHHGDVVTYVTNAIAKLANKTAEIICPLFDLLLSKKGIQKAGKPSNSVEEEIFSLALIWQRHVTTCRQIESST